MYAIGRFFVPVPGIALTAVILATVSGASAQERMAGSPQVEEYFRGVASYFRLPPEEVFILGEWRIPPEEIPVVLFLSRRAGVSPEALAALRGSGRSLSELTSRYELGGDVYHVTLPPDAGSLARARSLFESRPSSEWDSIELTDAEIISLVNVRILSEVLSTSPGQVLQARDRAGSYPEAYGRLGPRSSGD